MLVFEESEEEDKTTAWTRLKYRLKRAAHDRTRITSGHLQKKKSYVAPAHQIVQSVLLLGCIHPGNVVHVLRYRHSHMNTWIMATDIPEECTQEWIVAERPYITPIDLKSELAYRAFREKNDELQERHHEFTLEL